jgi:hypothetical protein
MGGLILFFHDRFCLGLAARPTESDKAIQKDAQRYNRALEHKLGACRDAYDGGKTVQFSDEKRSADGSDHTSYSTGQRGSAYNCGSNRAQEKLISDSETGRAYV